MSKITIAGDAVAITSANTLEELKTISKYRPKALRLMGGEDGKELQFAILVREGAAGSINANGATFGRTANDGSGKACITVMLPDDISVKSDVKEYVADAFGGAVMNLNKLEETLPAVLSEIKADKDKVMAGITVA